ncbi:MAG TPA: DUF1588 domain-containing protein, partial [Polyangiaceae bacterium]|nr:DUF1588 domain-containing protein [Polyangiaceae bacterium]
MLDDPRAADAIASFHIQWLALEDLASVEKDAGLFPEFGPELAQAMQRETELFADHVIRNGDGLLSTLLSAPYTFANAELAALYGASPPSGDAFELVDLDPAERSGLLTQASLLTMHAHPNQTSPVHRGKVIRENLLCDPPPPPPPTVNDQLPEVDPNVPITEQLAQHRTDPACSACHALMDPIGTGFEAYDSIGRYRTMIGDTPVDDSGEFVSTDDIDGPFEGVQEMAKRLTESEQVRECVAKQWLRFAIGRLEQDEDSCAEDVIQQHFAESGYDIRELIVAVAVSDAMRFLRVPEESSP